MAFVLDAAHDFPRRCNLEMVDLEPLDKPDDLELVRDLLTQHAVCTGSTVAMRLLKDWDVDGENLRQGHAARLPARALGAEPANARPDPISLEQWWQERTPAICDDQPGPCVTDGR